MPRRRSPRRSKTRGSDEREEARFLVVDLPAWGWILLIWGAVLALAGLALLAGQEWARWSTIVVVSLNLFTQLGFVGKSDYPLWALTALALDVVALYALAARRSESRAEIEAIR